MNAIWSASIQAVIDWDRVTAKGKVYLETREKDLEPCLLQLVSFPQSELITKVKWFLHNSEVLCEAEISPANYALCTRYSDKHLSLLSDMMTKEFDLKCCLAKQNVGPVEKRKLVLLTWVTQPYMDTAYLSSLPQSPF